MGGCGWGVSFVLCFVYLAAIPVSLVCSLYKPSSGSRVNKCFSVTYVNYFFRLNDVIFLGSGFRGFSSKKNNLIMKPFGKISIYLVVLLLIDLILFSLII